MFELAYVALRDAFGPGGGGSLVLVFALFGVMWIAAVAWLLLTNRLLRALRADAPEVHRRILHPFRWSWTTAFNPLAIGRLFAFVVLRRYESVGGSESVATLGARARAALIVVALTFPLLVVAIWALEGTKP